MAKIYTFHMYDDNSGTEVLEFYRSKIQIKNELGQKVAEEISEKLEGYNDIAIANEVTPPGERGGGGEGPLFPISTWLWIGLSVYVTVGKGFFEELGKDLARRLLSFLFDRTSTTEIIINQNNKSFTIIMPPRVKIFHLKHLEKLVAKLNSEGKYLYSTDNKRLIKID